MKKLSFFSLTSLMLLFLLLQSPSAFSQPAPGPMSPAAGPMTPGMSRAPQAPVRQGPDVVPATVPAPVLMRPEAAERIAVVRPPATPGQVQEIVACLKGESFDERRLQLANLCVSLVPVEVSGLKQMALTFSFDSNRLEFLKRAYASCPDKAGYVQLIQVLTYRSNQDELIAFMSR